MSSLAKLSIRGVRAFSPDDEEQIVEFFFPFTIIVGQNGCGKTTIIECLKYAITGGLPPGNKSGQAFVHDPRQSGTKQTKATVKLRFNSRSGQPTVVVRSMELTQNKSTLSFKQLDGVIRTSDPVTGVRNTLSHKCSDLDTTLPTMLGISKSILDNVLFCHQEEANWPLMEGAVLKKKFDDIFDSTRYTKALEVFRKKEKELLSKCKDIKVDLAEYQGIKNSVDGYEKELRLVNEAEENLSEERKEYKEKITEADREIAYYQEIVDKISRAQQELMRMQGLIDQHKAALKRQQSMVEQDLSDTHSMEDINQMLGGFDEKLKDEISKKDDLESKLLSLSAKIDSIHQNEMELKTKMGKLASEKEAHESHLKDRVRLMESIASAYNFNLQEITQTQQTNVSLDHSMNDASQSINTQQLVDISADDMQSFFRRTEEILKALNDDLKAHKEKIQREEDVIQNYLIELGGKLGALEKDKEEFTRQKQEYRDELNELNKEINSMSRFRRSEVEEAKRNAEKLAKERDAANNSTRLRDIEIDIRRIEDESDTLKRKQSALKEELDAVRESADAQTAIATLEEEFTRELEMLQEAVKDYSSLLCRFNLQDLEKLPAFAGDAQPIGEHIDRLGIDIRDRFNEVNARLSDLTSIYKKDENSVSEKTWSLRGTQQSLQALQQQYNYLNSNDVDALRRVIDQIRQFDSSLTIDETMPNELRDYINSKIAEYDDALDVLADPTVVKGIVKKLFMSFRDTEDPKCPCCMQDLDSSEKLEVFKERYRLMSSTESPLLMDSEQAEFKRSQRAQFQEWRTVVDEKIIKVLDFIRIKAEIEQCDKDIRDGDDEICSLKQKLSQRKDDLEDCKAELAELEELAKASDRWKDASLRIGQRFLIIQNKRKDLNILTNSVTNFRDRRIVDQEYSKLTEELEQLGNRKSELNAEARKLNQFCSQIAQQALNAENRARELASKFADSEKAAARKNEIYDLQKQLSEKEKLVDRDIPSLRLRIQEKDSEKQRMRHEGSIEEQKLLQFLQDFENTLSRLGTLTYQIDTYSSSDKAGEHQAVQSTLDKYADEVKACKEELSSIQPRLETIRAFINDQERQKRQLEYNIQLIEEKKSLAKLMERYALQKREMKNIEHYATAREELRRLSDGKTKLVEMKNLADGRYQEVMGRHRSLMSQLNKEEFKTIDKKLLKAKIEYDTTHLAAEDLKKYQNALDSALLQFHSKKLAEINKIIRELWLMTYKGEDITNIELQSGQEPGSRAQRSYNYRVVMSKGTTELDMRGRCSAGQRVLACIVIRLALAESFGINCGCIALDEPTVNLDYENKKGLAIALAQIIASRSQQRNFQLILITHDEEFVSMMKTELAALTGFSMPEVYFQVYREEGPDGKLYSKIQAIDWDNL